jgi:hypothetical protein
MAEDPPHRGSDQAELAGGEYRAPVRCRPHGHDLGFDVIVGVVRRHAANNVVSHDT